MKKIILVCGAGGFIESFSFYVKKDSNNSIICADIKPKNWFNILKIWITFVGFKDYQNTLRLPKM